MRVCGNENGIREGIPEAETSNMETKTRNQKLKWFRRRNFTRARAMFVRQSALLIGTFR